MKSVRQSECNVRVVTRIKPSSQSHCIRSRGREISVTSHRGGNKTFHFDDVLSPRTSQVEIFESVARPLVEGVLNGFNATIFAYGQTSSGKTYTMEGIGKILDKDASGSLELTPEAGVVPRCIEYILDSLRSRNYVHAIKMSIIELYNEDLFDLLANRADPASPAPVRLVLQDCCREDPRLHGTAVRVNGAEELTISTLEQAVSLIKHASSRRHHAETLLNKRSSRGHVVTTITVQMKVPHEVEEVFVQGQLYLVDLAGSENVSRSGAHGVHAKEAGRINTSLLTLGRVITSLTEGQQHIPYRESKLTRILANSLGGKFRTCMVATIDPGDGGLDETVSTLDYAMRARSIKNRPEANATISQNGLFKDYCTENARLHSIIQGHMYKDGGLWMTAETYESFNKDAADMQATVSRKDKENAELRARISELATAYQDLKRQMHEREEMRSAYVATELLPLLGEQKAHTERVVKVAKTAASGMGGGVATLDATAEALRALASTLDGQIQQVRINAASNDAAVKELTSELEEVEETMRTGLQTKIDAAEKAQARLRDYTCDRRRASPKQSADRVSHAAAPNGRASGCMHCEVDDAAPLMMNPLAAAIAAASPPPRLSWGVVIGGTSDSHTAPQTAATHDSVAEAAVKGSRLRPSISPPPFNMITPAEPILPPPLHTGLPPPSSAAVDVPPKDSATAPCPKDGGLPVEPLPCSDSAPEPRIPTHRGLRLASVVSAASHPPHSRRVSPVTAPGSRGRTPPAPRGTMAATAAARGPSSTSFSSSFAPPTKKPRSTSSNGGDEAEDSSRRRGGVHALVDKSNTVARGGETGAVAGAPPAKRKVGVLSSIAQRLLRPQQSVERGVGGD